MPHLQGRGRDENVLANHGAVITRSALCGGGSKFQGPCPLGVAGGGLQS